ncbi:MAG: DoxX family membrane protein [Chloroflexota bacterium]|jgi:thiosulfate dehydrogenase [quinone] large subunit|nr:DoxX family membrane protein [Chloroflexota bacterium]
MTALTGSRAIGILALRLVTGWAFLFAGLQKVFAVEPFSAYGFLTFGTAGTAEGAAEGAIVNPTNAFWVDLATNAQLLDVINFMVPFGQIAIGAALILGLATRFAAVMGFLMMAGFTIASWDFAHGFVNQTVLLGTAALVLGLIRAGEVYGIDAIVDEQPIVKKTPALRYVLG